MKSESGTFTPSLSGVTVVLNDTSLQVSAVLFQICKAGANVNAGTGFDDGIAPRGQWTLDDTVKDSGQSSAYSIYAKRNSGGSAVDAVRGKVDGAKFTNVGEFETSFATVTAGWTVHFIALGS